MVDDPAGEAPRWHEKIPGEYRTADEIEDHMKDRYEGTVPDAYIEEVAPEIENIRDALGSDVGVASDSEIVFDPGSGRWRDPDTGSFKGDPRK
jgi:hypothetical protein